MSGRPGPVVLVVPEDVLKECAPTRSIDVPVIPRLEPDPGLMERLHHVLGDAQRPLMIVGGAGWSRKGRNNLVTFATAHNLPVCCTFRRHDIFDNRHSNFVGELGIGADPALLARVSAADLLLAVGTRLGEIPTQGYRLLDREHTGQALVHIHPDPEELSRVFLADLGICADVSSFAAAACRLAPTDGARWRKWVADSRSDYVRNRTLTPMREAVDPLERNLSNQPGAGPGGLDLGWIMEALDQRLPEDAVVTVDAGNFSGWPQRYLTFGDMRRLLGPVNGAMGYGVPAAVAAKIIHPERVVVACIGDGCFGMTGQELATAVRYGVDPLFLVFENGMYGTIRMHQERMYPERVIGTGLTNPDFAALARAYGAWGETVERTEEFLPALERALNARTAAVVALRADPDVITTRSRLSAIRNAAMEHTKRHE